MAINSVLFALWVLFSGIAYAAPTVQLSGPSGLISPSSSTPFAGTASFPDAPPPFRNYGGVVMDVVGQGSVGSVQAKKVGLVSLSQSAPFQPYIFPSGNYTLRAKAISWNGSVSISTVSITIDNMPSINLITPLAKQVRPVNRSLFTGTVNFKGGCYSPTQCGIVEIDVFNANKQRIWWAGKHSKSSIFDLASINAPTYQWGLGKYSYEIRATAPYGKIYGADTMTTTGVFEFVNLQPQVSITLDKPSISACQAETGTITVNDPSGQGGTVVLSLPDGSTQSFTYTGGASAPMPFSYAVSRPAGTTLNFSATATSNSGATSNQPATATANVIAGGLNVTITPAKTVVEPKLQARSDVKVAQAQSAYTSPVEIYVTNSSSQPVTGANVSLKVETVDPTFAGHDHSGTLNLIKPTGTVSPSSGTTLTGLLNSVYAAGEFSAIESITATASYQGCTGTAVSSNITTQISGLVNLPVASPHVKIGGTAAHEGPDGYNRPVTPDNNHWVSTNTATKMSVIMTDYPKQFGGAGLFINDASLPKGGRFDAKGNWLDPHQTHRRGIDIDMHTTDTGGSADLVKARLDFLNDKAGGKFFLKAVRESSPNHVHIQFYPN